MAGRAELTIVLTLKDRSAYTARWMDYARAVGLPFRVLLADGGSDGSVAQLLADRKRFDGVDFEYVRYPPDRSYADYYAKMADALSRVETPYIAMADNDDFFVVDCVHDSIAFLERHPDYVACGGQGAIFWMHAEPQRADLLYGRRLDWKCTLDARSIDQSTACERIRAQSPSSSDTNYYDVKRTSVAQRQYRLVSELNLTDLFLVEILLGFETVIAGKTRRLPRLYLVRQNNSPGSSGGTHEERYGDWLGRMLVETWSSDFARFVATVSRDVADADGIPPDEARRAVIDCYRLMVAPSLLSNLLEEPTVSPPMPAFVAMVRRLVALPEGSRLKRLARFLYRRAPWISLDSVYGTQFLAQAVPHAKEDMQRIAGFLADGPGQGL